jgi:ABC-type microcin C transport system duplicated ATPase subunit YejF
MRHRWSRHAASASTFPIHGGLFRRVVAELKAVDEVSFVIHRGRTLGLVGESGCGKSTLGRMLLRLQEPTAGQVLFAGTDLTRLDRQQMLAYRQRIQAVFQDPYGSLSPRRTVGQTVREPLDVHQVGYPQSVSSA